MPTRYEYDLDGNKEWRWIAIAANGATIAVSPLGYESLQDCMHAVGLMHAPGTVAVMSGPSGVSPGVSPILPQGVVPGVPPGVHHGVPRGVPHGLPHGVKVPLDPPEMSLSRLQRRS